MINLKKKLFKTAADTGTFLLNFTRILGDDTLATLVSHSVSENTLTVNTAAINTTEVTVDGITVTAHRGVQVRFLDGAANHEYRVTLILMLTSGDSLTVNFIVLVTDLDVDYYGAVNYGDDFFSLYAGTAWENATHTQKLRALVTATLAIDRLNFAGHKYDATQRLQFPRGEDTEVPDDVIGACYLEALSLLDGADSDQEQANLAVVSQSISSVRTTYDRTVAQENIRAGITSYGAWAHLVPFLRDPREIILSRV